MATPEGLPQIAAMTEFFELLRQLERDGRVFGRAGRPEHEPARLGQQIRLGFATQDVVEFEPAGEHGEARVTVANFGLLGPEGPMPLHLTRWVLDRLSQRWFAGPEARQTADTTFVHFVDMLQHRMIALFYRAWADFSPAVQAERRGGGLVRSMLEAMAGIALPGTGNRTNPGFDALKLRQAAALAMQVEGPERLTLFIAEAFGVDARLEEFVGSWIDIPSELQTRLGGPHSALGAGAAVGARTFSRQSRVELRIGPLDLSDYLSFMPGEPRLEELKRAVRELVGGSLDVDFRIVLSRLAVPEPRLGQTRLGQTTWLARPHERGDADDMRLPTAVGRRLDNAEVGA